MAGTKRPSELIDRARRAVGRAHWEPDESHAKEPCVGCGEETAAGSVFYSDRHAIDRADGSRSFMCSLCDSRVRSAHKGRRMTDEEVRNAVENGSAAAYLWGSGGSVPL